MRFYSPISGTLVGSCSAAPPILRVAQKAEPREIWLLRSVALERWRVGDETIDAEALDRLFIEARTANGFLDLPVATGVLQEVYRLSSMGPTSLNSQPARFVFLTTPAAKDRLYPWLLELNIEKVRSAAVTTIVAFDSHFYEYMPELWHNPGIREQYEENPEYAADTATRNGTLGGAYFLMAARALGLDCGPMSGVDIAGVDGEFFPDGRWKTNFLLNLGHGDDSKLFRRNPRLPFDVAARVL